ncbi:lactonase family protein [Nocardia alni]|uniref:lactonase family protein n=1 Tax=Nocardia alni TaxID=2815723 RepID=UPI001C215170|nr:lactonase family protein [Nocardia alni]
MSRRRVLGTLAAMAAGVPLFGCSPAGRGPADTTDLLYLGSWGRSEIRAAAFDPAAGALTSIGVVAQASSSWSTMHPSLPILYVAGGGAGGSVTAYRIDPPTGRLTRIGATMTGGVGAVGTVSYISVDPATLLVANYADHLVAAVPIDPDGGIGAPASIMRFAGSGPNKRQDSSHPHCVVTDPSGKYVLVADFGADRVFVQRFDPATRTLSEGPSPYVPAPGSGPRRLVWHPDGRTVYLLNELAADIETLTWDSGTGSLTRRHTVSTETAAFAGTRSAAELALGTDARYLYASDRGENTLVVYSIDPHTSLPTLVQRVPCGGILPWSFTIHRGGRWMFVANQGSGAVTLFGIDPGSGRLAAAGRSLAVPAADGVVCLAR